MFGSVGHGGLPGSLRETWGKLEKRQTGKDDPDEKGRPTHRSRGGSHVGAVLTGDGSQFLDTFGVIMRAPESRLFILDLSTILRMEMVHMLPGGTLPPRAHSIQLKFGTSLSLHYIVELTTLQ